MKLYVAGKQAFGQEGPMIEGMLALLFMNQQVLDCIILVG